MSRPLHRVAARARAVVLAAALVVIVASPVAAQITLDGSLGPAGPAPRVGGASTIGADLGQIRDGNLFHSFGQFNVQAGESATFTGPGAIQNILSRVTGGAESRINGLLRSTIPGASLFLLNPRGVVFGPGAALDVGGAFHVSTADYVALADSARFHASLAAPSTLSVAPPVAFGFLGPPPGAIIVQSANLQVAPSQTLSLVGGDVRILGSTVAAPGGRVAIASIASAGEVALPTASAGAVMATGHFAALGNVELSGGALVSTSGDGGGTVVVRGRRLALDVAAINADTLGAADGAPLALDIAVREGVRITLGSLTADTAGSGRAGDVRIVAGSVALDRAFISSTQFDNGAGVGTGSTGRIAIDAGTVTLVENSRLDTTTMDAGRPGAIDVKADQLTLTNFSRIDTHTTGPERAGDLSVGVGQLALRGTSRLDASSSGPGGGGRLQIAAREAVTIEDGSRLAADTAGGDAGTINVVAPVLRLDRLATIGTETTGTGRGGDIELHVGELSLANTSRIDSRTFGPGPGGAIRIVGTDVAIARDSRIDSTTGGPGQAGDIDVQAARISLSSGSRIDASTSGMGAGGAVTLRAAERVTIHDASFVRTQQGDAGRGVIHIVAPAVLITGGGSISAETSGAGHAGDILLEVGNLSLSGGARIDSRTFGTGAGGAVSISAQSVVIGDGSLLSTRTSDRGPAGSIEMTTGRLAVTGQSRIESTARGGVGSAARGGLVAIKANESVTIEDGSSLTASGADGNAGRIEVTTPVVTLASGSLIAAETAGAGHAGDIVLVVDRLDVGEQSRIDSSTAGAGRGGTVTIRAAESMTIAGRTPSGTPHGVFSNALSTGAAGSIEVSTPSLLVVDGSIAAQSRGGGDAGPIILGVGTLSLADRAQIDSSTSAAGRGGSVAIVAGEAVSMAGRGSGVRTNAEGSGAAGQVVVHAPVLVLQDGASILAETTGAARAGNIDLRLGTLSLSDGSTVASSTDGAGAGGSVRVVAASAVYLAGGQIASNAGASGNGGDVTIVAPRIQLTGGAAISARSVGTGTAGNILLTAPVSLESQQSAVTTGALSSDGGNITLLIGDRLRLRDSRVTATVQGGSGSGGNIVIGGDTPARFVLLENSEVRADAVEGSGGRVNVVADVYLSAGSAVSASSTLGLQGVVDINARITDVTGTLTRLPDAVRQATALLREPCAIRMAELRRSTLAMQGRDGVPAEPGSPAGSFGAAPGAAQAAALDTPVALPRAAGSVVLRCVR